MNERQEEIFYKTMEKHADILHLLKLKLTAAELRKNELEEMFDAAANEVLQENRFYAASGFERAGLKKGDRILSEQNTFLMDSEEFDRYLKLYTEKAHRLGYTDSEGNYSPGFNGMEIQKEAEQELIDFFISLLPSELNSIFQKHKQDYRVRERLIGIIMGDKQ